MAQDEVVLATGSVDEGDVARLLGQGLEQPPQRGDADAGGQEQHLAAGADALVEAAVGALDGDPGAGPQPGEGALASPRSLTVIRSRSPAGAADSE